MRLLTVALPLFSMIITPKPVLHASDLITDVRAALDQKHLEAAQKMVRDYRAKQGTTPELINAIAWLGRGEFAAKQYDKADTYAIEVRNLALAELKKRPLDGEPQLPLALGASIEVQAQILAARGQRGEAVGFLKQELAAYQNTSIRTRIQKNINLLSLEGKPAPAIDVSHWLGGKPQSLAQLKGHPVLLFFWAHWCNDCKIEVSTMQRINATYAPRGLVLIGPTQHYGYVAGGVDAKPEQETQYIEETRKKYYARIGPMPAPLSEENFRNYGASTTPTLVLIDRAGIVRLYNPGKMKYEDLAAKIDRVIGAQPPARPLAKPQT